METSFLQDWVDGNFYLEKSLDRPVNRRIYDPQIKVPPYCKIFSLSSLSSDASYKLTTPYHSVNLESFDKKGRRRAHINSAVRGT